MIDVEKAHAAEAYNRVITRYPEGGLADRARARLEALHMPVPKPTPEAIAQSKAEEESRGHLGRYAKLMLNFHRGPDVAPASKVGEPTLTDPEQTSAPEVVSQSAKEMLNAAIGPDANKASVEVMKGAAPANAAPPRSDAPPVGGQPATTTSGEPTAPAAAVPAPKPQIPDNSGIQDLAAQPGTTVAPANAVPANPPATAPAENPPAATAPATAAPSSTPAQVNDAKPSSGDTAQAGSKTDDKDSQDSSSLKKKKKKKNNNTKDKGQDQK
jgi:outer membrane protein assembly factor BamD